MTVGGMDGEDVVGGNWAGRLARCERTTLEEERSGPCTVGAFDSELERAGASTRATVDELVSPEPRLLIESCSNTRLEVIGTVKLAGTGGTREPTSSIPMSGANVGTRVSGEDVLGPNGGTGLREKDCFRAR